VIETIRTELSIDAEFEVSDELMKLIFTREYWIYRDWQDGIGEFMTKSGQNDEMDQIIGFKEFEDAYHNNDDNRWILRTTELFDGFSMSNNPLHDFRVDQIKLILKESFYFLQSLKNIKTRGKVISDEAMKDIHDELIELNII